MFVVVRRQLDVTARQARPTRCTRLAKLSNPRLYKQGISPLRLLGPRTVQYASRLGLHV